MVVFDNTFLTLALHPLAKPPLDPSTKLPVNWLNERIELLLDTLADDHETIIIPTPVLSEFLILAGADGPKYLTQIDRGSIFRIEPFDTKAAIELATIEVSIRSSKSGRQNKRDSAQGTWAKIKFDRQIVTIAKVNGASRIYSDDEDVETFAKRCGLSVVKTWELPLPEAAQTDLLSEIERLEGQSVEREGESKEESFNLAKALETVLEPDERKGMFTESDKPETGQVNPDPKSSPALDEKPSEA